MTKKMDQRVVIVGAGQAGGELAAELRSGGFDGEVTLVGAEAHYPYSRPPLSKAFLRGEVEATALYLRSEDFYREHRIEVERNIRVDSVDLAAQRISYHDGRTRHWDRLIFATGGRPRRIQDPRLDDAPNVHYVRTIDDVTRLRGAAERRGRFVVVGGGYVGLEVTAVLRRLGAQVMVIEAADRLLARVTSPVVSEFFRLLHTGEGVDVRLGRQVTGYTFDEDRVSGVLLDDGSRFEVDELLIGIGMIPNDELAKAAGLEVDNGIVVDEFCRASAPGVYAIGDVSRHPDAANGGLRRLESMPNATAQARHAAWDILGRAEPYVDIPWFWSDQYETKLQAAGSMAGHTELVVRGDPSTGRRFIVFYLGGGAVVGVDSVGSPADYAAAKKLISAGTAISAHELRNPEVPLMPRRHVGSSRG